MRLLIAEDDPRLLKSLLHIFKTSGYTADGVDNGNDAYSYASSGDYDGLILDIMMPGRDGVQVLSDLRKQGCTTPALFLTARTEVSQRIEGLNAGADDYLPKPFATAELLARVQAMLRRRDTYTSNIMEFNGVQLDSASRRLIFGSTSTTLSDKEYQIIEMLFKRPNTIVPIERIKPYVWGWDSTVETSALWVHVSNLRKKFKKLNAPVQIRFAHNAGYVLEPLDEDANTDTENAADTARAAQADAPTDAQTDAEGADA